MRALIAVETAGLLSGERFLSFSEGILVSKAIVIYPVQSLRLQLLDKIRGECVLSVMHLKYGNVNIMLIL